MFNQFELLIQRVERTRQERVLPAVYSTIKPLHVKYWQIPREKQCSAETEREVVGEPIPFSQVPWQEFRPLKIPHQWGAPWETVWMTLETKIDKITLEHKDQVEAYLDLGWADHSSGFQCEALVRDSRGKTIKALNPRNCWVPLNASPDGCVHADFNIEASANPLLLGIPPFQITSDGDKLSSALNPIYTLKRADVVVRHHQVYHLGLELGLMAEILRAKQSLDDFDYRILNALNQALDTIDLADIVGTAFPARQKLQPVLSQTAPDTAPQIYAIGHAHIDSAWLWPLRETRRKVNRTLANVIRLLEDGKDLVFALPAAQHVAWLSEDDPELFERLRVWIKNGKIVPVGGMWVETDANLPSGESLCRQLIEGQSYFENLFDRKCSEIWLPDSFGYSAALPQIAAAAGIHCFLTQKISWNETNIFPHHTLLWEGLDGTRIFTHFPPSDTYGSEVSGSDLVKAVNNFKEIGKTKVQMLLYGYGDGGGGPSREMVDRLKVIKDFAATAKTISASPQEFWEAAQADYPEPPVWVGELYLERHRGTLTSQIQVKQGNRRLENLLFETELWLTTAAVRGLMDYPHSELKTVWRTLLLCQFHDILPGSSIRWVYREVSTLHQSIRQTCEHYLDKALQVLTENPLEKTSEPQNIVVNATSFPVLGIQAFSAKAICEKQEFEVDTSSETLTQTPAVYQNEFPLTQSDAKTSPQPSKSSISNGILRLDFNDSGQCIGFYNPQGRNYIPQSQVAGTFRVYQDFPNMWDAWDIDEFYRGSLKEPQMCLEHISEDKQGTKLTASSVYRDSYLKITWTLPQGKEYAEVLVEADWHEKETLLKLNFPIDIHCQEAQFETQFGFLCRPTHQNTSWDAARFEMSAQKWVRLSDSTGAFTFVNDSTYGWSAQRQSADSNIGGTYTEIQPTLIKSAQYPDPSQDQGKFAWKFRLYPDLCVEQSVAAGQLLNIGLRKIFGHAFEPLFRIEGAVVESVVMVPDESGDYAIRLYEATGGKRKVKLYFDQVQRVQMADLYYNSLGQEFTPDEQGEISFPLNAFQMKTLRVTPEQKRGEH